MIDLRTANRDYLLPNAANLMKSEDLPRIITSLQMIDEDIAQILVAMVGFAARDHTHEMADIVGLVAALAGKAASTHTHGIGTLSGVDLSSAANGQFMKFNGSIWIPATLATADLANKIITNAKLRDSDALTVIGRAAASIGSPADISATANDRLLARVGDVLAFVQMTIGMVPDNLLTFVKLASAAIASQAEAEAGSATNKLMTAERTAQAIAALASSQAVKITEFTAGGTYTKDPKARYVRAQVQGAGGGSGGARSNSSSYFGTSGAGAGGFYAEAWFLAANGGSTETITVGAGGTAGAGGSSPTAGGDGGASSFGSKIVAPGGGGGASALATTGVASGAKGGAADVASFSGTFFSRHFKRPDGSSNTADDTYFGIAGASASGTGSGSSGVGYGASAGRSYAQNNNFAGAAGNAGVVVITEYF